MDNKRCFLGAHLYRYDPHTDDVLDFGIMAPYEGISVMMLDEEAERFFAATFPRSHLYSWNMKGRDKIDFGHVSEHYVLALIKYNRGAIFFSDYYGRLFSINPHQMVVKDHQLKLPHPSYTDGMRNWMTHSVWA